MIQMLCPACGSSIQEIHLECPNCMWKLKGARVLGSLTEDMESEFQNALDTWRRRIYRSSLAVGYQSGNLVINLLDKLCDAQKQIVENYNWFESIKNEFSIEYNKFLNSSRNPESPIKKAIDNLVKDKLRIAVLLDGSPENFTIGVLETDELGLVELKNLQNIDWNIFVPEIPTVSPEKEIKLAGGLDREYEGLVLKLADKVKVYLNNYNIPSESQVIICSRLYGWQHLEIINKAIEKAGYSMVENPYNPIQYQNMENYVSDLIHNAPLRYPLSLLVAHIVDNTNKVTIDAAQLFPSGKPVRGFSPKQIKIRSANFDEDQLLLAIIAQSNQDIKNSKLLQCSQIKISPGEEKTLMFDPSPDAKKTPVLTLKNYLQISIQEPVVEARNLCDLQDILRNIPERVDLNRSGFDLAILIDTIADEDTLRDRCRFVNSILHRVEIKMRAQEMLLRVSIVAYGDHEVVRGYPNPERPDVIRKIEWKSLDEIKVFLDRLTPTPVMESDFESGLDEALATVCGFQWGEHSRHVLFTIGNRPPHSFRSSVSKIDWEILVEELKDQPKVESITGVCPLVWPASNLPDDATNYSDNFWNSLGYTACIKLMLDKQGILNNKQLKQIVTSLIQEPVVSDKLLKLPVWVD